MTLDDKAREIAHNVSLRCRPSRADRPHSEFCDRLTAEIADGLRWAWLRGFKAEAETAILGDND
jgi:hypothetical protein